MQNLFCKRLQKRRAALSNVAVRHIKPARIPRVGNISAAGGIVHQLMYFAAGVAAKNAEHIANIGAVHIRDIREAHKKDSESAPQTTVADELKGNLEAVENFKGSRARAAGMKSWLSFTASSSASTIKICQTKNFAG